MTLALLLLALNLLGCVSRKEVQAEFWNVAQIDPVICASNPGLDKYAIERLEAKVSGNIVYDYGFGKVSAKL